MWRLKFISNTVDIFPWTYAKHTQVVGVERIERPDEDWAWGYVHSGPIPACAPIA